MPTLMRHGGLELPVYDDTIDILDCHADNERIGNEAEFVRTVMVDAEATTFGSLATLLETTDQELSTVADICSAEVVGHSWGLAKTTHIRSHEPDSPQHELLPKGYALVAKVDTLVPDPTAKFYQPYLLTHHDIQWISTRICIDYIGIPKAAKPVRLSDMWPEQFMRARIFGESPNTVASRLILHDIEPVY